MCSVVRSPNFWYHLSAVMSKRTYILAYAFSIFCWLGISYAVMKVLGFSFLEALGMVGFAQFVNHLLMCGEERRIGL